MVERMTLNSPVTPAEEPTDDNLKLAQMLRDARSDPPNNIKLPSSIEFLLQGKTVHLHMGPEGVLANMQDNSSSFEGWALSFKRWLPIVDRVEITWKGPSNIGDPHYQRFLFRVQQFQSLFSDWFSVKNLQNKDDLSHLRTETSQSLIMTSPKEVRKTERDNECHSLAAAKTNEHKLECYIKDHPEELATLLGLQCIDRQFPVGLFADSVEKGNEIFPRGHSAIDLWGLGGNELHLFELKAEGNTPVGILAELFFYSYIMEGVQLGRYELQDGNEAISSTRAVRSYILAPKLHPLIDEGMLAMANMAFKRAGRQVSFGIVKIHPELESFELQMAAGNG
jgi:hypothetical protein